MRVVIADDAPLVREGVARLLTENGLNVVDQVADDDEICIGQELIELIGSFQLLYEIGLVLPRARKRRDARAELVRESRRFAADCAEADDEHARIA